MKRSSSNRSGFTLPEVVITGFITVLMMIPISRTAFSTIRNTRYARDVGTAISVGQRKLEEFSDMAYADITGSNQDSTLASGEEFDGFVLFWKVTTKDSAKIVDLDVKWQILGKAYDINMHAVYTDDVNRGYSFGL